MQTNQVVQTVDNDGLKQNISSVEAKGACKHICVHILFEIVYFFSIDIWYMYMNVLMQNTRDSLFEYLDFNMLQ